MVTTQRCYCPKCFTLLQTFYLVCPKCGKFLVGSRIKEAVKQILNKDDEKDKEKDKK